MRAGVYVRVSSTKQSIFGTSLDTQEAACRAAASDAGDHVQEQHIWRDTSSGATEDRPGLAQMTASAEAGLIDVLWVYESDRLSRNPIDLLKIMNRLGERDVIVHFVRGATYSGDDGPLLTYVDGWVGAQERRSIVERSTRSKHEMARHGYLAIGDCRGVYGYDYDQRTKSRVINVAEAEIVQEIFDRATKGDSYTGIAVDLQRRGVPTKRGGRWDNATVRGIVYNTSYFGADTYGRTRVTSRGTRAKVPRDEWALVTGFSPSIITNDQFDAAHMAVHARKLHPVQRPCYLLTGFTRCGLCHGPVIGRSSKHYRCSGSIARGDRPKTCSAPHIRKDIIEFFVWQEVCGTIRDHRVMEGVLMVQPGADAQRMDSAIVQAKRQLDQNELRQHQWLGLWQSDEIPDDVFRVGLQELKQEREQQSQALKELENQRLQLMDQEARYEAFAARCRAVSEKMDTFDLEQKREVLRAFGVQVTATNTAIDVHIGVHPDTPLVPVSVTEVPSRDKRQHSAHMEVSSVHSNR